MRYLNRLWTYAVANETKAGAAQKLDELGVEFVVGVPRATSHLDRRFQMVQHVNLARGVLRDSSYRTG